AEISRLTFIDRWFVDALGEVESVHRRIGALRGRPAPRGLLREAKELGLSDRAIGRVDRLDEETVRTQRIAGGILPRIRMIDTLAGEWPAATNYLYVTY